MKSIVFREPVSLREFRELRAEFPSYRYLWLDEKQQQELEDDQWAWVEVVYGRQLTPLELNKCHRLRWIHSPVPDFSELCLTELEKQGNVIVTNTKEYDYLQVSEYVMAVVSAFSKNLFHWKAVDAEPQTLWKAPWAENMWLMKNRIFLQIGLGDVGSEIAHAAKRMGFRVWGVRRQRSFHAACDKVIEYHELHSVLPVADVVSVAFPRGKRLPEKLRAQEFELMKEDTILTVVSSGDAIDEEALATVAKTGKFRGVALDAFEHAPLPTESPLWNIPNVFITPTISGCPETPENLGFSTFRYNLRQFLHGNFKEMKNLIELRAMEAL